MAYEINRYSGQQLLVLADGVEDINTTSLKLLGKGVSSYGEATAENFVHLLENFASPTQPSNPIKGQLWYHLDSGGIGAHVLKICRAESPIQWTEISTIPITTNFIQRSGGTMTGPLVLVPATADDHAVTRGYVDSLLNTSAGGGFVSAAGDTISGTLIFQDTEAQWTRTTTGNYGTIRSHLLSDLFEIKSTGGISFSTVNTERWIINNSGHLVPSSNNLYNIGSSSLRVANIYANNISGALDTTNATTKENIQDLVAAMFSGGNLSGITLTYNDTSGTFNVAVSSSASFTQLTDTPSSYTGSAGKVLRVNSSENAVEFTTLNYVSKSGDTMTGLLTLSADPTANLHAASKIYVDTKFTAANSYTDTALSSNSSAWQFAASINSAGGTSVEFTNLPTGYDFQIVGSDTYTSSPNGYGAQMGTGSNPTWITNTNYAYAYTSGWRDTFSDGGSSNNTGGGGGGNWGTNYISFYPHNASTNSTTRGGSCEVTFYAPDTNGTYKGFHAISYGRSTGGSLEYIQRFIVHGATNITTAPITAVRVAGGQIWGTFILYKRKRSA
jgi:hypothetical protein